MFGTNASRNNSIGTSYITALNSKITSAGNVLLNHTNGTSYSTTTNSRTTPAINDIIRTTSNGIVTNGTIIPKGTIINSTTTRHKPKTHVEDIKNKISNKTTQISSTSSKIQIFPIEFTQNSLPLLLGGWTLLKLGRGLFGDGIFRRGIFGGIVLKIMSDRGLLG